MGISIRESLPTFTANFASVVAIGFLPSCRA